MYTLGALTISDSRYRGGDADESGRTIIEMTESLPIALHLQEVVPDDKETISDKLTIWSPLVDLILTTGGTGLGYRDVTPEATLAIVDRLVPGLVESMREETRRHTPTAVLSRGIAGVRDQCLIINLPGAPKAVRECLDVILPVLPHALAILTNREHHHRQDRIH